MCCRLIRLRRSLLLLRYRILLLPLLMLMRLLLGRTLLDLLPVARRTVSTAGTIPRGWTI